MRGDFLLLLLLALPAGAGEVTFDVEHATGGVHRAGGPVPFHVRLENPTADDLVLHLEGGPGEAPTRNRRTLELAAGARKVVTFYLGPAGFSTQFEARLRLADGELLHEIFLSSVPIIPGRVVVGIFGDHPMGWGTLRDSDVYDGRVAHLSPERLPDYAAGLRAFRLLIWPDPRPEVLRPAQVQALAHWLESGGHLVLATGEGDAAGGLASFTYVRAAELAARHELSALARLAGHPLGPFAEPLAVAFLEPPRASQQQASRSEGAAVWLREAGRPVAITERRGLGSVTVFGFDPTDPRLARWPGLPMLWLALLERTGSRAGADLHPRPRTSYRPLDLRHAARSLVIADPGGPPPPVKLLFALLALYFVIIGPGEYLLLHRLRRLTWTWVTFPLCVVLFSLGAYAAATGSRSEVLTLRHILLRDLLPASGTFADDLYAGVFAPHSMDYRLAPRWARALPLTASGLHQDSGFHPTYARPSQTRRTLEPFSEQGAAAVSARLPKWSFLAASFHRVVPTAGAGLDADLEWRGARLHGQLVPRLGTDFADAWLLAARPDGTPMRLALGPLEDGVPVRLGGAWSVFEPSQEWLSGSRESSELRQLAENLNLQTVRRLVWERRPQEENQGWVWDSLLDDPHPELDWSGFLTAGGVAFVGWAHDSEARIAGVGLGSNDGDGDGDGGVARGVVFFRVPLNPGGSRS